MGDLGLLHPGIGWKALTGLVPHRNGLMALASGGHWKVDMAIIPALFRGSAA
jgi:hypothetical protein